MICRSCSFETRRLLVKEWHSFGYADWKHQDLADVVVHMLTDRVTRQLPAGWQGTYDRERTQRWIAERDLEGATLLVVDKASREPAGLVILFESSADRTQAVELRLGYLLAEDFWGQGLASELLGGLVDWSRAHGIASLAGGVERGNIASMRVLEKNGFSLDEEAQEMGPEEQLFRLNLKP